MIYDNVYNLNFTKMEEFYLRKQIKKRQEPRSLLRNGINERINESPFADIERSKRTRGLQLGSLSSDLSLNQPCYDPDLLGLSPYMTQQVLTLLLHMSYSLKLIVTEFEDGRHPTIASIIKKIDQVMLSSILRTKCRVEARDKLNDEKMQ